VPVPPPAPDETGLGLGAGAGGAGVGAGGVAAAGGVTTGVVGVAAAAVVRDEDGELAAVEAGAGVATTAGARRGALGRIFIAASVPTGATLTIPTAVAEEPAAGATGALLATAGVPRPLSRTAVAANETTITARSATRVRVPSFESKPPSVAPKFPRVRANSDPDPKIRFPLNLIDGGNADAVTTNEQSYPSRRHF
jgi:hypothetical protein